MPEALNPPRIEYVLATDNAIGDILPVNQLSARNSIMQTKIEPQIQALMEVGYLVVRELIPPAELQALRQSVDAIVDRAPAAGRVTMTDWIDAESASSCRRIPSNTNRCSRAAR